jgi:hypothetical protein
VSHLILIALKVKGNRSAVNSRFPAFCVAPSTDEVLRLLSGGTKAPAGVGPWAPESWLGSVS